MVLIVLEYGVNCIVFFIIVVIFELYIIVCNGFEEWLIWGVRVGVYEKR